MKIGIALSGGGIKGAAHIGVLKALEEENISISAVAGTSIGSAVASLYAMGYTPDEMLELFRYFAKTLLKADPKYLMSNIRTTRSILGKGILSGESIEEAVQECARLKNIQYITDIKMPIAIPTVDIKTKKKIVFTNRKLDETQYLAKVEGKEGEYIAKQNEENSTYINKIEIGKAVRASCSYPGVFAPLEYENYKFVDGGVLNNVPTEELPLLGVDKIITVKFPPKENENPRHALDVLFRCVDIGFEDRDNSKIHHSDFTLDIHLTSSSVFNTKKLDACYEEGYRVAKEQMEKLKKACSIE